MRDNTIINLLNAATNCHADEIALYSSGKQPLTYQKLSNQVNSIIELLARLNLDRKDCIAVVLPSGAEMASVSLSIACFASCAPLNPDYRLDEFEFYLSDMGVTAILLPLGVPSHARTAARKLGIRILELDSADFVEAGRFEIKAHAPQSVEPKSFNPQPSDCALLLHTSGTTAKPKLVPLTQKNLCTTAKNLCRALDLNSRDICLNVMPMYHIGGIVDLLIAPLYCGSSVVCTPGFSARHIQELIGNYHPTWIQLVPVMLSSLLEQFRETPEVISNSSIKFIRVVAAALPEKLMCDFEAVFGVPVIEVYGMTETTTLIATNYVPPFQRKPGSVGLAAGPEISILSASKCTNVSNNSGEIMVRGDSVMSGYRGLESGQDNCFIDGWFRTGDYGYLDKDSYLFITGRIKEIINRGGEKISPQEVENVLARFPSINEAACFALPDDKFGEEIAAAVVIKPDMEFDKPSIIKFLSEELAHFKVPRTIISVATIPRTGTGKIKRQDLVESCSAQIDNTKNQRSFSMPPSSPVGKLLAKIWRDILDVDYVGLEDDFFDLGGDSLKAINFINELQEKGGETVFVSTIFDNPTIDTYSKFLENHFPKLCQRLLGEQITIDSERYHQRLDRSVIRRFQSGIRPVSTSQAPAEKKNPRAIFLLCPPRSGSTLLRVMLAGSSELFSPPELYLLSFNDLAERKAWFPDAQRHHLEGNIRALMQAKNIDAANAWQLMEELESTQTSTQDYYRLLQTSVSEKTLVDKTPFYCAHPETLEKTEQYFDEPLYIHLTRHPYGMIRSFSEVRMEQLWYPRLFGDEHIKHRALPYRSSEMGELVWLSVHQNIVNFLKNIPNDRQIHLSYESLVNSPKVQINRLCEFLKINFDPEMVLPHSDTPQRMTDGLHENSKMIGDVKFHQFSSISSVNADTWKAYYEVDFLCDDSLRLARELGYSDTLLDHNQREEFVF